MVVLKVAVAVGVGVVVVAVLVVVVARVGAVRVGAACWLLAADRVGDSCI